MGMFGMVLDDTPEFAVLRSRLEGIELADSITVDGHKLLNVVRSCFFILLIYAYLCN